MHLLLKGDELISRVLSLDIWKYRGTLLIVCALAPIGAFLYQWRRTDKVKEEKGRLEQECEKVKLQLDDVQKENATLQQACKTLTQEFEEVKQDKGKLEQEYCQLRQELGATDHVTQNGWTRMRKSTGN
ncbi:hypothetical protein MATL_G00173700 [Megalops atlanticus]|uniref:Uncharacterized protein n=1 Tax=Megalops atlanticus TaxID=7932 RepID=A0A9D3PRI7_MEGAT|nr:hypothetical protein MATL_G00173700 [Megalops atlanticus]